MVKDKSATVKAIQTHGRSVALDRPSCAYRSLGTTWHFRLLHLAGLMLTLPVVALTRLLPNHWYERHDESIFVETNRVVLTALGFAFME